MGAACTCACTCGGSKDSASDSDTLAVGELSADDFIDHVLSNPNPSYVCRDCATNRDCAGGARKSPPVQLLPCPRGSMSATVCGEYVWVRWNIPSREGDFVAIYNSCNQTNGDYDASLLVSQGTDGSAMFTAPSAPQTGSEEQAGSAQQQRYWLRYVQDGEMRASTTFVLHLSAGKLQSGVCGGATDSECRLVLCKSPSSVSVLNLDSTEIVLADMKSDEL